MYHGLDHCAQLSKQLLYRQKHNDNELLETQQKVHSIHLAPAQLISKVNLLTLRKNILSNSPPPPYCVTPQANHTHTHTLMSLSETPKSKLEMSSLAPCPPAVPVLIPIPPPPGAPWNISCCHLPPEYPLPSCRWWRKHKDDRHRDLMNPWIHGYVAITAQNRKGHTARIGCNQPILPSLYL